MTIVDKFYPTYVKESILDIDYNSLYNKGKKVLIFDFDNTIISYKELIPREEFISLSHELKDMGFKIYILTNNHSSRIVEAVNHFLCYKYACHMNKPFKGKILKYINNENINKDEVIMIGDQLVTDIRCANRIGVDSVLVRSISRNSEHWYTRINRLREKRIVKYLIKYNHDYGMIIKNIVMKDGK